MLVEIPDLDVIFGLILAFIGGLFTLFVYSKLKAVSASNDQTKSKNLSDHENYLDFIQLGGLWGYSLRCCTCSRQPGKASLSN